MRLLTNIRRSIMLIALVMMMFLASSVTVNGVSAQQIMSEENCLERGFDPNNLSCDTCRLIDQSETIQKLQKEKNIDVGEECRQCCQFHKVNPVLHPGDSLREKYKYALLTYTKDTLSQYGEIKDFLERDVNDILSFKGDTRFKAIASSKSSMDYETMMQMMMMGVLSGGAGQPKLMFFDKQKKGGWSEDDEDEAVEVIKLRGWKREDLKDMLMTLLPSA
jgi:hypothetical protein